MNIEDLLDSYLVEHTRILEKLNKSEILMAANLVEEAFLNNKKIITFGNGGSASTASHYITDWNKMSNLATGKKFRGVSLVDNIGLVTAFANDHSYDEIFSGQLRTIMDEGDLVIGISGSGNSINVIEAIQYANDHGGNSLAILGYDGGVLRKISRYSVLVPSFDMQICEDIHLMIGHIVMKRLCGHQIIHKASS